MRGCDKLENDIHSGAYDRALGALYAPDGDPEALDRAKDRALRAAGGLRRAFSHDLHDAALFSSPGRTELGGNHTDHQRGHALCGSVDLDMLACAAPCGGNVIRVCSEAQAPVEVALDALEPRAEERGTSAALVRGVAAGIAGLGYAPCGFDAYVLSDVPVGSGLSSSAAYEVLIANILNAFCCGSALDPIQIAKIGQHAENAYFGKPCGLLDQIGSSVGGVAALDFRDPAAPVVKRIDCDLSRAGYALCIVDTGSSHTDLTDDYARITQEMGEISGYFGKRVLREVPETEFRAALPQLRERCGDRAVLRALHFYRDDRIAQEEADALERGEYPRFLSLVNASGLSSETVLQNTWSVSDPRHQAIPLALALGKELLDGEGAIRIHGGGFAGTVQAYVPAGRLEVFRQGMEALFGDGSCHVLRLRPQGGCIIRKDR